jgi:O-antigen/teichoic acid export membrane protein
MFDNRPETGQEIGKYITPFAYISIAIALAVSLFSEEVIGVLTPPAFHSATSIVPILAMYYGILFFGKINGSQLIFKRKTHITSALTLVSIVINILLNISFILKWGVIGAAWATMLAGVVSGVISFRISQKYYKIDWEYGKLAVMLTILMVSSTILVTLYEFSFTYGARIAVKSVAVFLYAGLGVRIKIISKRNCDMLLEMFSLTLKKIRG